MMTAESSSVSPSVERNGGLLHWLELLDIKASTHVAVDTEITLGEEPQDTGGIAVQRDGLSGSGDGTQFVEREGRLSKRYLSKFENETTSSDDVCLAFRALLTLENDTGHDETEVDELLVESYKEFRSKYVHTMASSDEDQQGNSLSLLLKRLVWFHSPVLARQLWEVLKLEPSHIILPWWSGGFAAVVEDPKGLMGLWQRVAKSSEPSAFGLLGCALLLHSSDTIVSRTVSQEALKSVQAIRVIGDAVESWWTKAVELGHATPHFMRFGLERGNSGGSRAPSCPTPSNLPVIPCTEFSRILRRRCRIRHTLENEAKLHPPPPPPSSPTASSARREVFQSTLGRVTVPSDGDVGRESTEGVQHVAPPDVAKLCIGISLDDDVDPLEFARKTFNLWDLVVVDARSDEEVRRCDGMRLRGALCVDGEWIGRANEESMLGLELDFLNTSDIDCSSARAASKTRGGEVETAERYAEKLLMRMEMYRGRPMCVLGISEYSEAVLAVARLLQHYGFPRLMSLKGGWEALTAELEVHRVDTLLLMREDESSPSKTPPRSKHSAGIPPSSQVALEFEAALKQKLQKLGQASVNVTKSLKEVIGTEKDPFYKLSSKVSNFFGPKPPPMVVMEGDAPSPTTPPLTFWSETGMDSLPVKVVDVVLPGGSSSSLKEDEPTDSTISETAIGTSDNHFGALTHSTEHEEFAARSASVEARGIVESDPAGAPSPSSTVFSAPAPSRSQSIGGMGSLLYDKGPKLTNGISSFLSSWTKPQRSASSSQDNTETKAKPREPPMPSVGPVAPSSSSPRRDLKSDLGRMKSFGAKFFQQASHAAQAAATATAEATANSGIMSSFWTAGTSSTPRSPRKGSEGLPVESEVPTNTNNIVHETKEIETEDPEDAATSSDDSSAEGVKTKEHEVKKKASSRESTAGEVPLDGEAIAATAKQKEDDIFAIGDDEDDGYVLL